MTRTFEIIRDLDEGWITERYTLNEKLHRDPKEGPAEIIRKGHESDPIYTRIEKYCVSGKLHRADGPAYISTMKVGGQHSFILVVEEYYLHGRHHRDVRKGPASISRVFNADTYDELYIMHEEYWLYGARWRDPADGPHTIWRKIDGTVSEEEHSDVSAPRPRRSPANKPNRPGPEPK